MAATIGIKIANGEFYSILEENSLAKKRLILTTVHDNQSGVQIDLYKSYSKTMVDALYIGSLVIEKIMPKSKGGPSVALTISSDPAGNISAEAMDTDPGSTGEHQYLNVSLRSLDEDYKEYDIPDFELEGDEQPPVGLYEKDHSREEKNKPGFPWFIIVFAVIILLILCFSIWFFFLREKPSAAGMNPGNAASGSLAGVTGSESPVSAEAPGEPPAQSAALAASQAAQTQQSAEPPAQPAAPASPAQSTAPGELSAQSLAPVSSSQADQSAAPASQAPQSQAPAVPAAVTAPAATSAQAAVPPQDAEPRAVEAPPPPVIQAPAQAPAPAPVSRARSSAPVASYRVPATIPREGIPYQIRFGDTLWDIAEVFYRNPWLYWRIAHFNNIRNPDRIRTGTTIRIPPPIN